MTLKARASSVDSSCPTIAARADESPKEIRRTTSVRFTIGAAVRRAITIAAMELTINASSTIQAAWKNISRTGATT